MEIWLSNSALVRVSLFISSSIREDFEVISVTALMPDEDALAISLPYLSVYRTLKQNILSDIQCEKFNDNHKCIDVTIQFLIESFHIPFFEEPKALSLGSGNSIFLQQRR